MFWPRVRDNHDILTDDNMKVQNTIFYQYIAKPCAMTYADYLSPSLALLFLVGCPPFEGYESVKVPPPHFDLHALILVLST